ncbi:hypothetical protein M5689_019444 [Euphorbia peplus]|nr:hypothetical protein M5689_019444 [Euphorbia peplus]
MNQRVLTEFRTPQHPSLGSNKWGGSSPLLARHLPKESLEQSYTRLNTVRTRDEIFPIHHHFDYGCQPEPPKPRCSSLRLGFWSNFGFSQRKENKVEVLGSSSFRMRWFPRWDPKHRWPQGW